MLPAIRLTSALALHSSRRSVSSVARRSLASRSAAAPAGAPSTSVFAPASRRSIASSPFAIGAIPASASASASASVSASASPLGRRFAAAAALSVLAGTGAFLLSSSSSSTTGIAHADSATPLPNQVAGDASPVTAAGAPAAAVAKGASASARLAPFLNRIVASLVDSIFAGLITRVIVRFGLPLLGLTLTAATGLVCRPTANTKRCALIHTASS